jgi:uncharacterized protein (DUF58 family)
VVSAPATTLPQDAGAPPPFSPDPGVAGSRSQWVYERLRALLGRRGPLSAVTGLGWLVLAGSVAAMIVGARLGWIELTLSAVTGLLTLLFCAALAVGRTALRIDIDPSRRRMVVGDSMDVAIRVTNMSARRLLMLTMEIVVGPRLVPVALPNALSSGSTFATSLRVDGERRGVIPLGPATSVRGDPIGLVRRQVSWAEQTEIFVHPRTTRLEPFGSGLLRDLEGRTTEDVSMSDLAFHTLREYVPGDDRRYIHWRSSAKVSSAAGPASPSGKFLVRQFRDTRRTHLLVIVDGDAASYVDDDEFETAISVGASIAVQARADELDASLLVADQPTRRVRGRDSASSRVLDVFARARTINRRLAPTVALAAKTAPDATYAIIITGANSTFHSLRRAAAQLSTAVRVTLIRVDPVATSGMVTASNPTALNLTRLEDLRGLLVRGEVA